MRRADIPPMAPIRQHFERPRVGDPAEVVREELARIFPGDPPLKGKRIGVTAGSRGIHNIAVITRSAVDFLKQAGAEPFIIPAMGSHGGATAEGQKALIAHYGITEESMGVPLRAEMETVEVGRVDGVTVHCAVPAWESDGVLLLNRIKPHTELKGVVESGLVKIGGIGLGKFKGAEEYHGHFFGLGLDKAITIATSEHIRNGKIVGGLAIIENAYCETARIVGLPPQNIVEGEKALLAEARSLMPRLPLDDIDVLFVKRMGKNLSGTGLDTNIIGREIYGYIPGESWKPYMPRIHHIVVSELSAQSNGNAIGMGLANFGTARLRDAINHETTYINGLTGLTTIHSHMPVILDNDREAMSAAMAISWKHPGNPLVICIRDTLSLTDLYVSEACLPLLQERDNIEITADPAPLPFDDKGYLPWPDQ